MNRLPFFLLTIVCVQIGHAQSQNDAIKQEQELQKSMEFFNQKQANDDREVVGVAEFKIDTESPYASLVTEKVAIDSLWSATGEGYAVVYEHPDGSSAEIGKIYNDDEFIYPVYAVDGPWYEIAFRGGVGYVYERDCILQSGMGDI